MFSANVLGTKMHQLAEKWTSPRPPRERLRCNYIPSTAVNQIETWQADSLDRWLTAAKS